MAPDAVRVQFKADVTDLFDISLVTPGWGFSISEGDRSAFVPIGTLDEIEKYLHKRDDSLVKLVIDSIRNGDTENVVAQELLYEVLDGDEGIVINGELVSQVEIEEVKDINGISFGGCMDLG